MNVARIMLVAPDWSLDNQYDTPTEIHPPNGLANEAESIEWLAHEWFVKCAAWFPDAGVLYVVPERYRHCRMCGLHGADDGAWVDAPAHLNLCDDGEPDPHGGICPGCLG